MNQKERREFVRGLLNDWFRMMQLGFVTYDALSRISVKRYVTLWRNCYLRKYFKV